jgi:hypothetical protein
MSQIFDTTDFSARNYIRLLEVLTSLGYKDVEFASVVPEKKHMVLRHDVDFDLEAALRIARLEARNNYVSTFFVLLGSEFYNLFSESSQSALSTITSLGHKIGLHFDTSLYDSDLETLSEAADKECRLLEEMTEQSVTVISMHRPPAKLIGENLNFANRLNTYAPRFTREIGYCSDSRGGWHYGSPLESKSVKNRKALHLLTHPIWWTQSDPVSPQQSVTNFLLNRQEFLSTEAERNCSSYKYVKPGP